MLAFGDVDAAVEAFEDARLADRAVSLRQFLPQRDAAAYVEILQELVRVDLDHRFRESGVASLEDYRNDHPELFESPEIIEPLAFEEYRLKLSSPRPIPADEFARRYRLDTSRWPAPVKDSGRSSLAASTASALDSGSRVELFPGQRILDFSIVGELGRGAFSRVYLARQMSLSERFVVLKVSSIKLREAERLARLQHTNIVPIYSVHDYEKYSILCMPWFGSTTLKDVVKSLRPDGPSSTPDSQLSGQMLLSTVMKCESQTLTDLGGVVVDHLAAPRRTETQTATHIRSPLAALDLEHSAVWLTLKMAEGLTHAHARGILHRDLKPANVLLTEDGQPMILDFNLAVGQEDLADAIAGGTLPYMSPEQIASVESYQSLDPASDVFSLGVMLYELVTGRLPFVVNSGTYRQMIEERRHNVPQARSANPRLSEDVNSIIAKCLQPDVAQRYASAADLAEDLDRHLRNLPLVHAPNRSLPERAVKWVKRHPQVTSSTGIIAIALVLVIALGMAWWRNDMRLLKETTARQAEDFIQKTPLLQGEAFEAVFGEASFADTRELLKEAIAPFRSATTETGKLNASLLSPEQRTKLDLSLAEVDFLLETFERSSQSNLRSAAPFAVGAIPKFGSDEDRIRFGVSCLVHHRDLVAAKEVLSPVTEAHPDNFAASLLHGMILMETSHGGSLDSEALLSAAIASMPNSVNAWHERGLCRIALKKFEAAADDFTRVVELNSSKLNALVSRAICFKNLQRFDAAIADLTKAIDGGFPETRIYFLRASVYRLKGNTEAAEKDKATGLSLQPSDARSWVVRALEQLPGNPEAALADLREAQTLNPQSHDAFRNLAMVLSEYLKRPEDAIQVQTDALQIYADDPYLWVGRAVLHARAGRREQAIRDAEAVLGSKEPLVIYSAACVYALTSEKNPDDAAMALKLLADSIRADNSLAGMAPTDQDLKSIHARPEFRNILAAAQILNPPAPPQPVPSQ